MPGTVHREPIFVGNNDDAHRIVEMITQTVTIDFGAVGLSASAFASASASVPGAKANMMFFLSPATGGIATNSAIAIVQAVSNTADTVTFTAANYTTANIDAGAITWNLLGVKSAL